MDEIELLVAETFEHFHNRLAKLPPEEAEASDESESELPDEPGVLYHLQRSTSIFVIRTFVSKNIRVDFERILERPEDFPSLRLLEGGEVNVAKKLRFFLVENPYQAEIIHDQLNNRRFPIDEEMMCNLSDPGFSWWLTPKEKGFQLSFTLSVGTNSDSMKLGPLGDQQLALKNFQHLGSLITDAGLSLSLENEMNRVQFSDGEEFLMEELKDLFEFGVVSESMVDLFKILAKKSQDISNLETTWYYLQELAAMRRFWIQVQYDLNS